MKPLPLTMAYFSRNREVFRTARVQIGAGTPCRLHTQDFAQVFWVEKGAGTHMVNNQRQPLTEGTLVVVRPTDCHGIRTARDGTGLTVVSVIFSQATLDFLRERYFAAATTFFWTTAIRPFTVQLTRAQLRWLRDWTEFLSNEWYSLLAIERFLMELLHELQAHAPPVTATAPAWLQDALTAIRDSQHFRRGTPALARLAGRSPQHVNRALKEHCGLTATEVVNRARMEHASQELAMSNKKIIEICLECGFQNLGHFYQVFRQAYGTTPRQFRHRQRAVLS